MKMRLFHLALTCALLSTPSVFAQSMPLWKSATQTGNIRDLVLSAGNDNSVAAWLGKKTDTIDGHLQNPSIQDGSAIGTEVAAAKADVAGNTVSSYLNTKAARARYIFLGGADNFALAATNMSQLVSSGKVALYEHANGMSPLTTAERQAIQTTWASTGASIVTGGGNAMAEVGDFESSSGYAAYFGGSYPVEANMNVYGSGTYTENGVTYTGYLTEAQFTSFKGWTDSFFQAGTKNMAPVVTPNFFDLNAINLDFATDDYWKYPRLEALYGGAIAIDSPPTFAFWQGDGYIKFIASEIKWALANNLRITLMLSPFNTTTGNSGLDANFYYNSARLLARLQALGATPTSYVAQSYCACTNSNPLGGESLSGSIAQVALLLLNAPVSDPGTAVPQSTVAGVASEAKAFANTTMLSVVGSIAHNSTYRVFPSDIQTSNYAGMLGDMAYQSSDNVTIAGGRIGYTAGGSSEIYVTLMPGSSFLTQVPLVFQGGGSYGNQVLEGGSDNWLHLDDPYTTDKTKVGMAFGTDANAPIVSRLASSGGGGIQFSSNIHFTGSTNYASAEFYSSYTADKIANPSLRGGTNDHFIHIFDDFTDDSTLVGFSFNTNNLTSSFGSITGLANNGGLAIKGQIIDLQGIPRIVNMSKANILATAGWDGMIVNDSDDHVPVISEGGKWYPLQLGAALQ